MLREANLILLYISVVFIQDCNPFIVLYDTEDGLLTDSYDCVYQYSEEASTVKYWRRLATAIRSNNSDKVSFAELHKKNITPNDLLVQSVPIEDADRYAAYLFAVNISNADNDALCLCTAPRTFGKYCEYRYEIEATFYSNLIMQFNLKFEYNAGYTYGKIYCYETVECDSGLMCLDWRDICDGKQQCMLGVDEDNCDLLEFNECEPDEYRCRNGMCVPEEYFVDGKSFCKVLSKISKKNDSQR